MKKTLFVLTLTLLFTALCFAQVDRSKQPTPGPAPEINIAEYQSFILENGLKVFVVENDKLPVVSFRMIFDRDPILEKENAGYIQIASQLLKTGTKTRTKAQIDEETDFIGAELTTTSGSINGSSLKKHSEKLFELMSDILLNADFKQDEFEKIKKQTLSNIALSKDQPNAIADNVRRVLDYGKEHPYGEITTEKTVETITLEKCNEFYNNYYSPSIAYLAIVGDITVDQAKELVEKYLSKWNSKQVEKFTYENPKAPLIRKVALVDRDNSVQSVVNVTYPIDLKTGSEDVIKVSVLNTLLGGSFSARLNQNLREKHAYTYGARTSMASDELVGNFTASAEVRNAVTDSTVNEILEELKRLRTEKVGEAELQRVKNYMTGSFARSLESPQTVAGFALNIARYNLPKDYYKNYLKNLNAVTVEDIEEMAKKYIKPNNCYILVVGKGAEIADNLKRFSVNGKIDYYDIYGEKYDPSAKTIPEGVTAQTVLDKYINAIGGKEKLNSVKDKKVILKGEVQGLQLTLEIYQKVPNKYYQKLDAGVMKQESWFDGEKGKQAAMGRETPIEGEMLESMKVSAVMNIELHLAELGITPELVGIEQIDGKDAYKIVLTLSNGKQMTYYYDVETGYSAKQITTVDTPQGSFTSTITFNDFRDVNGIKYPYELTQSMGPQVISLKVESIEYNSGLDDSIFQIK